jgi:hypothetical protein
MPERLSPKEIQTAHRLQDRGQRYPIKGFDPGKVFPRPVRDMDIETALTMGSISASWFPSDSRIVRKAVLRVRGRRRHRPFQIDRTRVAA